jgi:DNA polymerase III delta subunit
MSAEELATLASTPTLFGGARTFVLTGAINSERQEEFLELAEGLAESPHTFIFEEEKLLKASTVALEKAGAKIEIEKKPASTGRERGFDPFKLTFALGAKDKKRLWLGLIAAFAAGEKPEAVAGLLAWKARAMRNAALSRELVWMYHDSHRGLGDLALLLERFALNL